MVEVGGRKIWMGRVEEEAELEDGSGAGGSDGSVARVGVASFVSDDTGSGGS